MKISKQFNEKDFFSLIDLELHERAQPLRTKTELKSISMALFFFIECTVQNEIRAVLCRQIKETYFKVLLPLCVVMYLYLILPWQPVMTSHACIVFCSFKTFWPIFIARSFDSTITVLLP